jgi:hypothetical protein
MIRFACPTCQKVIKAEERAMGRRAHCPRCSQTLIVPVPDEIKNKPRLGVILPESGSKSGTPADDESIEHSFDDCVTPADSLPLVPPPVRRPPPDETRVLAEENTDPFREIPSPSPPVPSCAPPESPQNEDQPPFEYWVPPGHSVTGFISTAGAVILFLAFLLFHHFHAISIASLEEKLKKEPGNKAIAAHLARLKTFSRIAFWVGISGVVFGLFWATWSFRYRTKIFWSVAGCVANGVLLIWIVLLK